MEKLEEFISCFDTVNLWLWRCIALAIQIVWPAFQAGARLPGGGGGHGGYGASSEAAGEHHRGPVYDFWRFTHVALPALSYETVAAVLPDAFTIAILAAIESLLSCVVADEMIGGRHNSNMELVAQVIGNTASALFAGSPPPGPSPGRRPTSKRRKFSRGRYGTRGGGPGDPGVPYALAALIPMPCIAAILLMVAYNMSGWRTFLQVVCRSPKATRRCCCLPSSTVVFDLVVAIGVGLSLACLLFMTRMANVAVIKEWEYVEDQEDAQGRFRHVPEHVMVYEIDGPMFFGAADQIPHIDPKETRRVMILRMRSVPALDITALNSLAWLWKECQRHRVQLILSHVNEQPLSVMRKSGFYDAVGRSGSAPISTPRWNWPPSSEH